MSTSEILEHLKTMDRSERQKVWQVLEEIEFADTEETPEMLAAIDEAREDVRKGRTHTVEEARAMIVKWTTKSS
jgi:predicted transcriptional regulator